MASGGARGTITGMDDEDKYARILVLLEKIDKALSEIKGVLDKYKPLIEKLERRFNVRWGQRVG